MSVANDGSSANYLSGNPPLDYNAAYTITGWFKTSDATIRRSILSGRDSSGPNYDSVQTDYLTANRVYVACKKTPTEDRVHGGSVISDGTWYFFALRRTSVTSLELLIDGVSQATSTNDVTGRAVFDHVRLLANGSEDVTGLLGSMAQVRVWTTNLTDVELATEKASHTAVKTASLAAEWRLVNLGTATVDSSGGGWPLSIQGTLTTGADDPPNVPPTVNFQAVGALANNATTATLACVAPTCAADDILIAAILGKDNQVITPPDATWTKFVEVNNTANQRATLAWKRAVAGDSGATFNFTKPTDNNLLFCGCISAWRGCITNASPIDATTPTTSANASADAVTYATFDPIETNAFVVAVGFYNDDLTTAGAISGTNPTFANNWDLETPTGTDASIFGYSGTSDGAATGARSHATTSTVDAVNIGVLFGLVAVKYYPAYDRIPLISPILAQ